MTPVPGPISDRPKLDKNVPVKILFTDIRGFTSMSEKMKDDCNFIKDFLYKNVYNHSKLKQKRYEVEKIVTKLFKYFLENFNSLPEDWSIKEKNDSKHRIICDYISGMTDRYASKLYKSIYE